MVGSAPHPQTTPWRNLALPSSQSNHLDVQHKMNTCQQKENECGIHVCCIQRKKVGQNVIFHSTVWGCVLIPNCISEIPKTTLKNSNHTTVGNNLIDIF
jgi:hypothetical protein